jgi:hypothetical protein
VVLLVPPARSPATTRSSTTTSRPWRPRPGARSRPTRPAAIRTRGSQAERTALSSGATAASRGEGGGCCRLLRIIRRAFTHSRYPREVADGHCAASIPRKHRPPRVGFSKPSLSVQLTPRRGTDNSKWLLRLKQKVSPYSFPLLHSANADRSVDIVIG